MQEFSNNLWNLKVHCCVHKSLPLAPILRQINPIYTTPSYFSKINFNIIPHLCLGLPSGLFHSGFPTKTMYAVLSHVCCMLHISPSLTWSFWFFEGGGGKEYMLQSSLLTQFSLTLNYFIPLACIYSQHLVLKHSVCVLPLMSGTKFHAAQSYRQNYSFAYSSFYVFRKQVRRQKVLNWMVASITWIESAHNFLMNQILICYCSKYLNVATFSNDLLSLYVMMSCILVMRQICSGKL
jgi:hypothetical protein